MKEKPVSMFSIFPMRAITGALCFTMVMFFITLWHVGKSYQDYKTALSRDYRFQFLINALNSGPTMTTIVRKAADTGNLDDENLYLFLAGEVDTALKEILAIVPDQKTRTLAQKLDEANSRLVGMEQQAFHLVRHQQMKDAHNLLYSDEYRNYMKIFDGCNAELAEILKNSVEREIFRIRSRAFIAFTAIVISLPILIFVWMIVLDMVRKHLLEQRRQERFNTVFMSLEQKLSAVSTPKEAAQVIMNAADDLFGWDSGYVVIYSEKKDIFYSVINFDIMEGERREIHPPIPWGGGSPFLRSVLTQGAKLRLRENAFSQEDQGLLPFGNTSQKSLSLMFAPIRKANRNVGVLSIQSYTKDQYDSSDLELLQVVADHCSSALDRAFAEEKFRQQERLTRRLSELGKNIAETTTPKEAAMMILTAADDLFGWDASYISIYSPEEKDIYNVVVMDTIQGRHCEVSSASRSTHVGDMTKQILEQGPRLILRHPPFPRESDMMPFGDTSRRSASLMFTPIRKGDRAVGVLSIQSYSTNAYSREDLEALQILADHCSGALDRTLTEMKLHQSEERLRLIMEQIPALLWSMDTDLRFTQILGSSLKTLELDSREILGKTLYDFFKSTDPAFPLIAMHKQALQGLSSHYEMERQGKYFDSYVEPLYNADGAIIGCVFVAHDVTERKHAEEQIRKTHEELERRVETRTRDLSRSNALLKQEIQERRRAEQILERSEKIYREAIENASGVPYRLIYADDRYDFMGREVMTLLGYSPEEFNPDILRSLVREIKILDPDAPQDHDKYVQTFKRGEVPQYRVDIRIQTRTGEEKWMSDCSVPIRDDASGRVIGSLGILQDITKRKQVEVQARLQQEQLVHADKMVALGFLVSGVAHEINNPNNFIMLNTPILLESWECFQPILDQYYAENGDFIVSGLSYSEMRDHIPLLFSGIVEGSKRIKNIVQELRDFARQHPADLKEDVNINAVVNSALTLISNMIKKSTNYFHVKYGSDLPKLRGNFQRLEQVIINLIQNACQSLPDKNKSISVTTTYDKTSHSVLVQIRDEGAGIPPDIVKHICDPFFTTKRDTGGSGLGLSITSNIIDEHGGRMDISSETTRGTTVTVILPLHQEPTSVTQEKNVGNNIHSH